MYAYVCAHKSTCLHVDRYLSQLWTLSCLSNPQLDTLKSLFRTSVLGADEEIIGKGRPCLALFVVASGALNLDLEVAELHVDS